MMRIRSLHLERFGHFNDKNIDFGTRDAAHSDFHIIYGSNEAGKTTTMEGYLRLLYGFKPQESYSFHHARNTLRVSAQVEIDGVMHEVTRLPTRQKGLLDGKGEPLPETFFQKAISGLSVDDYRALLCLDDASIEAGGEGILNSKGDIGRLLFSAAAGIGNLSKVLDNVREQTEELYKPRGSKNEFRLLKKERDDLSEKISELDTNLPRYREFRAELDKCSEGVETLHQQKQALDGRKRELERLIRAYPLVRELREAESDLEPLCHYPEVLDISSEMLVQMATEVAGLNSKRDMALNRLQDLRDERQKLVLQPDLLTLAEPLQKLEEMKQRVSTAQSDLGRRRGEAASAHAELTRLLAELGINAEGDVQRFVPTAPHLAALDRARDAVRAAEMALKTAKDEASKAARKREIAKTAHEKARKACSDTPDLAVIFTRHDGDVLLEEYRKAKSEMAQGKRQLGEALIKLSRMDVRFDAVPVLRVTHGQAVTLASDLMKAKQAFNTACNQEKIMHEKWLRAQTLFEVGAERSDLVHDEEADAVRKMRDALWLAHRNALDEPSADAFEAAMRTDDAKRGLREGQSTQIAAHRQTILAEREARHEYETAKTTREVEENTLTHFHDALESKLDACGLPTSLKADEFAQWVYQVNEAETAKAHYDLLCDTHRETVELASAFEGALSEALGQEIINLDALARMARDAIAMRDKEQEAVRAAARNLEREEADVKTRGDVVLECQAVLEQAQGAWSDIVQKALPDMPADLDLMDAVPTLHALRESDGELRHLQKQVLGMENNLEVFSKAVAEIAVHGDMPEGDPLEVYRALAERVAEAQAAQAAFERLEQDIEDEETALKRYVDNLSTLSQQVVALGSVFSPNITTDTLEALRDAVGEGQKANDLRANIKKISGELLDILGVPTRGKAEEALAGSNADDAQAELQEVEATLEPIERNWAAAIADKAKAEAALDAVGGDDAVAVLEAQRHTLTIQMESVLERYMEQRLGLMVAERAIQRYRDTHRSAMLEATEEAFCALTDGKYHALKAEPHGTGERLMAIQASDGTAKQADALSKGTCFQLYLALRAAAYEQMGAGGTLLPFFCDDVFETFDDTRTRAACRLMQHIGRTGQAIYLTHHKHVVDIAHEVCGDGVQVHNLEQSRFN